MRRTHACPPCVLHMMLPSAPLRFHVERVLANYPDHEREAYAFATGITLRAASRHLGMLRGQPQIPATLADKLAIFAGLHPALLWPDQWRAA